VGVILGRKRWGTRNVTEMNAGIRGSEGKNMEWTIGEAEQVGRRFSEIVQQTLIRALSGWVWAFAKFFQKILISYC
jgi:hypothetical protein